jgi:DNA repair protein RadC
VVIAYNHSSGNLNPSESGTKITSKILVLSSGYLSSIIQITIKNNQVNLDALCLLRKLFI